MTVGTIHRVVSFGDSLSDRGKMYKRLLWGFIPLGRMSGLAGKSPYGRFTNQYTWLDHWAAVMAESQYIKQLETQGYSPDEIWELITTNPSHKESFHNSFSLDNSEHVRYYGEEFYLTYCEGGATAGNWASDFSWDIALGATRKIVNTLENERRLFLEEEKAKFVTPEEKKSTLISTFIGANDLITVHDPKSMSDADIEAVIEKAVAAQMAHIQALIAEGYTNFALKNLPNLGLTPRYQQLNKQELGEGITNKYNAKLKEEYEALQARNSDKNGLKFNFYDVNKIFDKIYQNPEKYGFDRDKLAQYFKDSDEFKKDGIKHAGGYMFWDEVHPSAKMHKLLEEMIDKKIRYKKQYNSQVVAKKEALPRAELDFDIEETNDEQRLAQIERDVLKNQNKVVFVKIKGNWACYRYDEGRATNHFVSHLRTQELDVILSEKTQKGAISPNNQFILMKLSIRQNWNRGIYFYQEGGEYKARIIHKPFIPGYNDAEKQSCYEDLNLSELLKRHKTSEVNEIWRDLEKLATQPSGSVIPADSTLHFVESHCQGQENDENKYIIEPAVQGYTLHFREMISDSDKAMVVARRGTSVLVFQRGDDTVIGYCGRQGYTEQQLDTFSNNQLNLQSQESLQILKRSPIHSTKPKGPKDTDSVADTPFDILQNLVKKDGFSFEESSLMSDFSRAYKEKWTSQGFGALFGTFFMRSRIDPHNSDLEAIFRHALKNGGERSRSVMIDLGWIDKSNALRQPFESMLAIKAAYETVQNPENNAKTSLDL